MKIYIATLFVVLSLLACQDKEMEDATFRLEVRGYVEEECYTFGEEQTLYLWSSKAWADNKTSTVEYYVDPSVLDDYNAENGTALKLLPDSCYRMEQTNFDVDDDAVYARFKVRYLPEKIINAGGNYNVVEYALPMRIMVNGVPQDDRYGTVVVGFLINPAVMNILNAGELTKFMLDPSEVYELPVVFETNYNNNEWITLDFDINEDLVEQYNEEHGTDYKLLPDIDKAVSWLQEEAELEKGVNTDSVMFYVDFAQTSIDKGDHTVYLLPVKLNSVSSTKCKIEDDVRYFAFASTNIDQAVWNVTTTSTSSGSSSLLNDGNDNAFWLWNWMRGPEIATNPENITYTLIDQSAPVEIGKIECHCFRGSNSAWLGAKDIAVQISDDGESWTTVKNFVAPQLAQQLTVYNIELDAPVVCKAIRLSISSYYSDGICFSEIIMHAPF